MKRRTFLKTGPAFLTGGGGCLSAPQHRQSTPLSRGNESTHRDHTPNDGYPPLVDQSLAHRTVHPSTFPTADYNEVSVSLAPIDVVYYWYQRREARFIDARSKNAYARSHILGAVLSPAAENRHEDPVRTWPKADRIVCYCGCPHHLSTMRAAELLSNGYTTVYALDEGFWEWHDRNYPMAGVQVTTKPKLRVLRGRTPTQFAGETVWIRHLPTGQLEASMINADGLYTFHLRFADLTKASLLTIDNDIQSR